MDFGSLLSSTLESWWTDWTNVSRHRHATITYFRRGLCTHLYTLHPIWHSRRWNLLISTGHTFPNSPFTSAQFHNFQFSVFGLRFLRFRFRFLRFRFFFFLFPFSYDTITRRTRRTRRTWRYDANDESIRYDYDHDFTSFFSSWARAWYLDRLSQISTSRMALCTALIYEASLLLLY